MSEPEGTDPGAIRSLAVTTEDVLAALEARQRGRRDAVLRVTPPFSARMRARLHVEGTEGEYEGDDPIHVRPEAFLPEGFPRFPGRDAESWRSRVRDSLRERVELDGSDGPFRVRVRYLG